MIKAIQKQCRVQWRDALTMLAILASAFAAGLVIEICVQFFAHESEFAPIGIILAGIAGVYLFLAQTAAEFSVNYSFAVKMGMTRRRFLVGATFFAFVQNVLTGCIVWALYSLDYGIAVLRGATNLGNFPVVLPMWWLFAAAGVVVLLGGFFCGALMQRYGKAGFWVIYCIVFLPMILGGVFADAIGRIETTVIGQYLMQIINFFTSLPTGALIALVAIPVLACLIFAAVVLLRGTIQEG